jgi:NAD(P)-dependent dehydrogenase (short-subunit alcohol dehydrogenase family)
LSRSDCNSVAPGAGKYHRGVSQRDPRIGRSNRLGVPEHRAAMVAFLFSDDGAYVTGQTFLVDGGANFT